MTRAIEMITISYFNTSYINDAKTDTAFDVIKLRSALTDKLPICYNKSKKKWQNEFNEYEL